MFKDGKLFGKLNVIDLLVILIAIAVVVAVGMKLVGGGKQTTVTDEQGEQVELSKEIDVKFTVRCGNVDAEVADEIQKYIDKAKADGKPGEQAFANGMLVKDNYITEMKAMPSDQSASISVGEYTAVVTNGDEKMDLFFTIEGKSLNKLSSTVGTQEVRVGRGHYVKSVHFELYGTITQCEWGPEFDAEAEVAAKALLEKSK